MSEIQKKMRNGFFGNNIVTRLNTLNDLETKSDFQSVLKKVFKTSS